MKTNFYIPLLLTALMGASPVNASVILTNGSFETIGDYISSGLFEIVGWDSLSGLNLQNSSAPIGFEGTPTVPTVGERFLRLASDNYFTGEIRQNTGSLESGHTYKLTGNFFGGNSVNVLYGLTVAFTDGKGTTYASNLFSGYAALDYSTESLSYTAVAADEGRELYVELKAFETSESESSRGGADNLILTDTSDVPEPTSAVLLGSALAAIGLIVRRVRESEVKR